jgi:signal transduction histidine kinase
MPALNSIKRRPAFCERWFAKTSWIVGMAATLMGTNIYGQSQIFDGMSESEKSEYDSLLHVLPKLKGKEKMEALARATYLVTPFSNELSKSYLEQAEKIAAGLSNPHSRAYILWLNASYYERIAFDDKNLKTKALEYADSALKIFEINDIKDDILLSDIYFVRGFAFYSMGELTQALNAFLRGMGLSEKTKGMEKNHVHILKRIGEAFYYLGEYNSAIHYYTRALEVAKECEYPWMIRVLHNNIGLLYEKLGMYHDAKKYYAIALENLSKEKVRTPVIVEGESTYLSNIANAHFKLNQIDSALYYFQKGYEIRKGLGYAHLLIRSLVNIGKCHVALKNNAVAQSRFSAALKLANENEDEGVWLMPLYEVGKFYAQIGKADSAILLLKKGAEIAKKRKDRDREKEFYEALSEAYAKLGLDASALNYYKQYSSLKDTLNNESKQRNFIEMNAKYDVAMHRERAEAARLENSLNEERLKRQRWFTVAVAAVLAMMAFTAFMLFRAKNRQRQINQKLLEQNEEIRRQKLQIEAQAFSLKEQSDKLQAALDTMQALNRFKESMIGMAAHDLKNPLNAILVISEYIDDTQTKKIIQTSSRRMLNLILTMLDVQKHEAAGLKIVPKDFDSLDAVWDAYSQVAYLLETKGITFSSEKSKGLSLRADYELTVRVLVNLLTNAAKYTPANGNIRIEIQEASDRFLAISIQDSGEGIPEDKLDTVFELYGQANAKDLGATRSTGMGLYFCKVVVEAHGGVIFVESEVNVGTKFTLTLPQSSAYRASNGRYIDTGLKPIKLTSKEREALAPFMEELKKLEVYEAGKALSVLEKITGFDEWKSSIKDSIFSGNEQSFRRLIKENSTA